MLYIGIDLGTSAVKLLAMDEKGKIVNIISREYPICFPQPGWSEQNPEDWYDMTLDGLNELLNQCDRSQVVGVSFGGQNARPCFYGRGGSGNPARYSVE